MSFTKRIKRVLAGDTHRAGGYRLINGRIRPYILVNGKRVWISERGIR